MSPETLAELRAFQIRRLRGWLASEEARDRWLAQARHAGETLLAARVESLVDLSAIERAIDAATSAETLAHTSEPLARAIITEVGQRLNERREHAADFFDDDARGKLDALVAREDIVDEELATTLIRDTALEAVMRDVLYDALIEFDKRANPFVADWGLPALIDTLPLIGKGVLKKAIMGMRDDFNKRLQPEIRRFLEGFARRSLEQSVELTLAKGGEPEFVALRKNILAAVLDRPVAELFWPPEDERGRQLTEALASSLRSVLGHALTRAELKRAAGDLLIDRWGAMTVAEVLDELAIAPPEVETLADALWPLVRAAVTSDAAMEEVARWLDESHAAFLADRS